MKRKPDFVIPMHGEREVLEIYGWPLPPVDNDPRCDCGHLFEICNHPNCSQPSPQANAEASDG